METDSPSIVLCVDARLSFHISIPLQSNAPLPCSEGTNKIAKKTPLSRKLDVSRVQQVFIRVIRGFFLSTNATCAQVFASVAGNTHYKYDFFSHTNRLILTQIPQISQMARRFARACRLCRVLQPDGVTRV